MSLVLNDEQQMLRDAAQGFLTSRAPLEHLRTVRDDGLEDGFSRELWQEIAEMGWAAILVPEQYGGLEYGYAGIGIVLEECGRTLTPSPLLSTVTALPSPAPPPSPPTETLTLRLVPLPVGDNTAAPARPPVPPPPPTLCASIPCA